MHRQGVWFSHSSNKNLTACKWSMKVLTRWYCSRFKLLTWYSVFVASISIFDMVSRKINALLYHLILIKIQFLLFCDRYVIWKVHHIIKYETACVLSKTTITRICINAFNFFFILLLAKCSLNIVRCSLVSKLTTLASVSVQVNVIANLKYWCLKILIHMTVTANLIQTKIRTFKIHNDCVYSSPIL